MQRAVPCILVKDREREFGDIREGDKVKMAKMWPQAKEYQLKPRRVKK